MTRDRFIFYALIAWFMFIFLASCVAVSPAEITAPANTVTPTDVSASTARLTASDLQTRSTAAQLADVVIPARDLRDLTVRLKPGITDVPLVVNATDPDYQVGDRVAFWVHNLQANTNISITAELAYKTHVAYAWVETGKPYDRTALRQTLERFSTQTYPDAVAFFGSEWNPGVDNDPRLHILYTAALGGGIAGYFSSADEYSQLTNSTSNQKEMFYIDLQYISAGANSSYYESVLAHELQHMIHWHQDHNEAIWVNEGLSQYVKDVTGFPPDMNFVSAFMNHPDTQLNTWFIDPGNNANHYGSAYLMMRYLSQRFGKSLIKTVVAQPNDSIAGIEQALHTAHIATTFDTLFADWVIANYANQPDALGQAGLYGYRDLTFPAAATKQIYGSYPVGATQATLNNYGTDYVRLEGAGNVTVHFAGKTETRLVDTEAPSGTHLWWSNRGDMADATLTRPFDLRTVAPGRPVTMTVAMWWDIEKDLDYGYVLVSRDGHKWTILPGQRTNSANPSGNNFGAGYTGVSAEDTNANAAPQQSPAWVTEQFDLSPYAGQSIWLRFEYITDDGINGAGWLLDDLRIPALDYVADFEGDVGGWESAGWLLTDNRLPQHWLLQVMEFTNDSLTDLRRVSIDADGHAQLAIAGLGNGKHAILAISALAPVTTEPAGYEISIEPGEQ